jgi:transposase-like protein
MEKEVESQTEAAYGEKDPERMGPAQRRPDLGDPRRGGRTSHPQAAQGLLLPGLPGAAPDGREGAHRRVQEAYVQGLSTRSVDDLVQAMGIDRHLQEPW